MGLALILLFLQGTRAGLSAFCGGLAYWLPTLFFMWRVAAHAGARAAGRFAVAFFGGEAIKLVLSGVLFVLAVKYLPVNILYVMIGFIGAILAFWVVSISSLLRQGVSA